MFIRAGNKIINTDNISDIYVIEPHVTRDEKGEIVRGFPLELHIFTTAIESDSSGGEYSPEVHFSRAREIRLRGREAEEFMAQLNVDRSGRPLPPLSVGGRS